MAAAARYRVVSTPGRDSNGWKTFSVDLTPALGVGPTWILAWEFASGSTGPQAGYFLDAVQVTAQ